MSYITDAHTFLPYSCRPCELSALTLVTLYANQFNKSCILLLTNESN